MEGGFEFQVQRVDSGAAAHRDPGAWQSLNICGDACSIDGQWHSPHAGYSPTGSCFGHILIYMAIRDFVPLGEKAYLDASDGRLVGFLDHGASCVDSVWPCGGFLDDADDRLEGSVDHAGVPDRCDAGVADLDELVRHWPGPVPPVEVVALLDEARFCPAGDPDDPSGYPVCCGGGRGAHHPTCDDLHEDPAYFAVSRATGVEVPGLPYSIPSRGRRSGLRSIR
jgi:hypothetical protein